MICPQLKMLPMERASLPMPSKTAPTPFMTPCAVPQALSVRAHAIAKKLRLIITAPFFRSDLRTFEKFAKNFWSAVKKWLPLCLLWRTQLKVLGNSILKMRMMGSNSEIDKKYGLTYAFSRRVLS